MFRKKMNDEDLALAIYDVGFNSYNNLTTDLKSLNLKYHDILLLYITLIFQATLYEYFLSKNNINKSIINRIFEIFKQGFIYESDNKEDVLNCFKSLTNNIQLIWKNTKDEQDKITKQINQTTELYMMYAIDDENKIKCSMAIQRFNAGTLCATKESVEKILLKKFKLI